MSNECKLNIIFYINGLPFKYNTLEKQSLGGSETMGLQMSRAMADRGHDIVVFCNINKPDIHGNIRFIPIQEFNNYMAYTGADVCIVQRIPEIFSLPMKSKINILWQHDNMIKRQRQAFRGVLWNVDEVWGLSEFHIKQMADTMQVPENVFWKTRNGIDTDIIKNFGLLRQKKRLIYTSRPERGLDVLLHAVMPLIWSKDAQVELIIAGYDNTTEQMKPFYDSLHNKINEYKTQGFNVRWMGNLTKKELYKEYQKATLYVYPSNFEEISCITGMECMANGLPIICSDIGALPETLSNETAVFIKGEGFTPYRPEYAKEFADAVLDLLNDEVKQERYRQACYERAKQFGLKSLAELWEKHFYELFEKRISNKETLAKHFYRNEDIMACLSLNIPEWNEKIKKEYSIIYDNENMSKLYQDYGKGFLKKYQEGKLQVTIQPYARVKYAIERIKKYIELQKIKTSLQILDYGCAIGNEAIQFVNEIDCKITAVNVSAEEMEIGKELAEKHCKNSDNIIWVKADMPDKIAGEFDVVFAGEILEHVSVPETFINQLEKKCKKGGLMIFTIPTGCWGDTRDYLEMKGHLWSFDKADLKDLFRSKKQLSVIAIGGGINPKNKEYLGWYVISYIKNEEKTGHVDMNRKLLIQAPRQTISTCMIIGGEQEGLLHRCMKSVSEISDEILIGDTGISDECKKILQYYQGIKIIDNTPNPLMCGFSEARNYVISQAKSDFIFWVDTDEELLLPENIYKYLRHNKYAGYSIRQHHFSAQPPNVFKPDLPIRLFRNNQGIKFYGWVHEHPEIEMNKSVGFSTILSDVDIAHDGYLTEEGRRKRFDRNYKLLLIDREKNPDRQLGKFLIMRDYMHMARYILEQTKGNVIPEVADYCKKTIEMYQTEFLGKDLMMSGDGLMFYSEALALLGKGLEYEMSLDIKPQGAVAINVEKARFESKEDFIKFIGCQIQARTEMFEGKYA